MADRARSKDGTQETRRWTDDPDTPSDQGRAGGNLERKVGTRDTLRQAEETRPGVTRVRKSDEKGQGGLGGHHGTGDDQ